VSVSECWFRTIDRLSWKSVGATFIRVFKERRTSQVADRRSFCEFCLIIRSIVCQEMWLRTCVGTVVSWHLSSHTFASVTTWVWKLDPEFERQFMEVWKNSRFWRSLCSSLSVTCLFRLWRWSPEDGDGMFKFVPGITLHRDRLVFILPILRALKNNTRCFVTSHVRYNQFLSLVNAFCHSVQHFVLPLPI
jgi:hypothetical protein